MYGQVTIGHEVAGESVKLKAALYAAIKTYTASVFDIMTLLHKVKSKCFYLPEFNTMTEYCESLGLKQRKAQYLLRIADVMERAGLERTTYEQAGISNLREIARLDPDATYENPTTKEKAPMKDWVISLVTAGPNISLDEVQASVRVLLGEVGPESKTWLNLPYTRLTMESTIRPGIEKAKMIIGTTSKTDEGMAIDPSDASAVELIIADFLGEPDLEKS